MNALRFLLLPLLAMGARAAEPVSLDRWPGRDGHPAYEALVPAGESVAQGGIYDPSIAYDSDDKTGWLAYSAILRGPNYTGDVPVGPYCETHLAKTTDGGQSWSFIQTLNHSRDGELQNFDGQKLPGVWRYEVASLVHDPEDTGHEWKLFTHSYFWNLQRDRMPAYGWIALQTASNPAGQWSEPQPLLGSAQFPPKPYDLTRVNVNALDSSLAESLVYSEPGAFSQGGTLYLSLTALGKTGPQKVVLLSSPDHGRTWRFAGTLVTNADAEPLGYRSFDGSALATQSGRTFFLVSPASADSQHVGTMVIEFADLATGKLQRDATGRLIIRKHLREQPQFLSRGGAGQSCFDEHNTYGGLIMPQMIMKDAPHVFQLWSTRQSLVD